MLCECNHIGITFSFWHGFRWKPSTIQFEFDEINS